MKTHINITIDVEIAELLKKEKNVSLLINSYLRDYFDMKPKSTEEAEQDLKFYDADAELKKILTD